MVVVGGKIEIHRTRQERDAETSLEASFQNEGGLCTRDTGLLAGRLDKGLIQIYWRLPWHNLMLCLM